MPKYLLRAIHILYTPLLEWVKYQVSSKQDTPILLGAVSATS